MYEELLTHHPSRDSLRRAWTNPEAYATTLFTLYLDQFGDPEPDEDGETPCLTWAPETILMEIERTYALDFPRDNLDRLLAAISVHTSDDFWKRPRRFIELCNVLSGEPFQPDVFNPATVAEMAWGMTEVLILKQPDPEDQFSPEIRSYIGFMLEREAVGYPPDILGVAVYRDEYQDPLSGFADDPEMYAAISDSSLARSDEITAMVRQNLGELLDQLQELPLRQGDASETVRRARRLLAGS